MYLEPIFSSEDIMRQMPAEARNFKQVDKIWRAIQSHTVKHPKVLVATDFKSMLNSLRECNRLLDDIQKGLNDYLEKKRLFFPRLVRPFEYHPSNSNIPGSSSYPTTSFWKSCQKLRTRTGCNLISRNASKASTCWTSTKRKKSWE